MKEKPEQDADLFRQAVAGATPLAPADRIVPSPKLRKTVLRNSLPPAEASDNLSDHGAGDVAITEFLRPGLNRLTLRKLRHGEWRIQDELDLHGLNSDDARKLLAVFLHDATQRGLRCVNVIHGKGWRSEGRDGIIKVHTRHWLAQHPLVLAFCEAPPQSGGGGAVWVLLKNLS
ncbi:MAG: Smr/MutS family protein [Sideroxyarcus sp.]|nr:Smr/MutS family protein [Sideroxyarcus sp.]